MQRDNRELWLALLAIALITGLYLAVVIRWGSVPAASGFFGHSLGVFGFVLMLMTETLYSLRKRSLRARWGRVASWLKFHIFTGIVGPYLVLLHSSWAFNGLAGVVLLLTVVIVMSGFIGRYIYTAIPRTATGAALEADEVEAEIERTEAELSGLLAAQTGIPQAAVRRLAAVTDGGGNVWFLILGRTLSEWSDRFAWWRLRQRIAPPLRAQTWKLQRLTQRRRALRRQMASLGMARHLLGIWHTVHIPLGMVLFTTAFIHVLGAIYYATLLR